MTAALVLLATLSMSTTTAPVDDERGREAPSVVAGASVAGFVGGTLFALPAVLALLPGAGPAVAFSAGVVTVAAGAAFGAFLGDLTYARLAPSSIAAVIAAAGACVGVVIGGAAGAGASTGRGGGGALFPGLVGAVVGGAVGAAVAGALGAAVSPISPRTG